MTIELKKVHTIKDLTISLLILAAGAGLFFVNTGLGILVGAFGLLLLIFYKDGYKKDGTDVVLTKKALDVAHASRPSLIDFLEGENVEPELDRTAVGGVVRLEIYYNAEASVALVQLFDFLNYMYEPATDLVELRGERARKLIGKL